MDIGSLRCFLEASKTLNYTIAAKNLFISRQALSQRIKALESELGAPLFFTSHRRMQQTELGEALSAEATDVLARFDTMERNIRSLARKRCRPTGLSLGYMVATLIHLDSLVDCSQKVPSLVVDSKSGSDEKILSMVREGESAFALVVASSSDLGDCASFLIEPIEQELLVPEDHPLSSQDAIVPSDLEGVEFVTYESATFGNALIIRECRHYGFAPSFILCGDDLVYSSHVVRSMHGVTWNGLLHEQSSIKNGLVAKPLVLRDKSWGVYLAWDKRDDALYPTADKIRSILKGGQ